jgi:hypothetical protein
MSSIPGDETEALTLLAKMVTRASDKLGCAAQDAIAQMVADLSLPEPTYFFLDEHERVLFAPESFMLTRLRRALDAFQEMNLTLAGKCPKS